MLDLKRSERARRSLAVLLGLVLLLAGCAAPTAQLPPAPSQLARPIATVVPIETQPQADLPPSPEPLPSATVPPPTSVPTPTSVEPEPSVSPLAIVVENSVEARPQSGLDKADVVYETLAEGGISRFLAVFTGEDGDVVGPVRSLRHYFAFIAADYGADLVHIGASPQGFAWRDALGLGKLDESAGDPGVWRNRGRYAPHNAYTNTRTDRELLVDRGGQQLGSFGPLLFDTHAPAGEEQAPDLNIQFTPWAYDVGYRWDSEAGVYRRSMQGTPHRDAITGAQLGSPTVVVQFAEIDPIVGDPKNRLDINLAGAEGRLLVFSQGAVREGRWQKDAPQARTAWLDASGEPLAIRPGRVWVEIAPIDARVTW